MWRAVPTLLCGAIRARLLLGCSLEYNVLPLRSFQRVCLGQCRAVPLGSPRADEVVHQAHEVLGPLAAVALVLDLALHTAVAMVLALHTAVATLLAVATVLGVVVDVAASRGSGM